MLPLPIRLQGLKSIAGWNTEIVEHPGLVQKTKLSQRHVLNIGR
jgi:hypothetical protein